MSAGRRKEKGKYLYFREKRKKGILSAHHAGRQEKERGSYIFRKKRGRILHQHGGEGNQSVQRERKKKKNPEKKKKKKTTTEKKKKKKEKKRREKKNSPRKKRKTYLCGWEVAGWRKQGWQRWVEGVGMERGGWRSVNKKSIRDWKGAEMGGGGPWERARRLEVFGEGGGRGRVRGLARGVFEEGGKKERSLLLSFRRWKRNHRKLNMKGKGRGGSHTLER